MTKENIRTIIEKTVEKLEKLGVEGLELEKLENNFLDYPEDMLEDIGIEEFEATIIDIIAFGSYNQQMDKWETTNNRLFSFDVERFGGAMYGDPLECLNTIFKGDFVVSDVVEDDWSVGESTGKLSIDFKINGEQHHYDAQYNYDWFDTDILKYIAEIVDKKSTGRNLYITPVGPQSVLVFYETKEWVAEFEKMFWKI